MPHLFEASGHIHRACDIAFGEFEPRVILQMREVPAGSGDEIVQAGYVMTVVKKAIAKMRSDESGSPGYEMTHTQF